MKSFFVWAMVLNMYFLHSQTIEVMSFNLRYDNNWDKENAWSEGNRKEKVLQLIKEEAPMILSIQEGLHHQLEYLDQHIDYQRVGVGRDDGKQKGEYAAIYFDKEIKILKSGHFWLSQTPEKPSLGWDATCCHRIATWAKVRYQKRTFYVFNTHFDHEGVQARKESSLLIIQKIKEIAKNKPVILMGDFNSLPQSEAITTIKKTLTDTYAHYPEAPSTTYTGFATENIPVMHIDYIFTNDLKSDNYKIIDKKINGKYISDHYPVRATIFLD